MLVRKCVGTSQLKYMKERASQLTALQARRYFASLLLGLGVSLVLLLACFRLPLQREYPVDAWVRWATNVHEPEEKEQLGYAHTKGNAELRFPDVGTGIFFVTLSVGGPGGSVPSHAQLATETQQFVLDPVQPVRHYHVVLPSNQRGQLQVRVTSPPIHVGDDPRPLGVMIEGLAIRSISPALPPLGLCLSTAGALLLLWFAISTLRLAGYWHMGAVLLVSLVLSITVGVTRGQIALGPVWIVLGLCGGVAAALAHADTYLAQTSRFGLMMVLAGWRLALWLLAGGGLLYSQAIYRYGQGNAFNFGATIDDHTHLLWRTFAAAWMQWDSEHYAAIARAGYTFADVRWPTIAFFPLYPLLIRFLLPLVHDNIEIAALLVSHLALLGALLLLYDLLVPDVGKVIAYRTTILLLAFPGAFFFVAGYTESLALALAVAAVWAIRRQRWWLAGVAGSLLAATRVPGVLISLVIVVAYMQHGRWNWRSLRPSFLSVLLPPLGLAVFMLYQWWSFDTPVAFLIAQQSWNNGAAGPWAIPLKLWKNLHSPRWEMAVLQFIVWGSMLWLTLLALRRLPVEYGLTGLLLLLPAYLANQEDSLVRHVLIGFPAFVVLAQSTRMLWLRWATLTLMSIALVILTLLFVNGFFIA